MEAVDSTPEREVVLDARNWLRTPADAFFRDSVSLAARFDSSLGAVVQARTLVNDRAIGRVTLISTPAITVNEVSVRAITATARRGPMLLSAAQGRLPAGDDQITLGASTMRTVAARIGDQGRAL